MIKPEVNIVTYMGSNIIIPVNFGEGLVFDYVKAGLELDPLVRKILWNDRVRRITADIETETKLVAKNAKVDMS